MTIEQKPRNPFDLDREEIDSMDRVMEEFDADHSSAQNEFNKGDLIQATVVDFDDREVFLDLGGKQEGRCLRSEFDETPERGGSIPVIVIREGDDGYVRLSRREAERAIAWDDLKEAFTEGAQLSGQVLKQVNHGFIVTYSGVSLFLPQSQVGGGKRAKGGVAAGAQIEFKILDLKEKHRSAVISHRKVVEEMNVSRWNELCEHHHEGDVVEGTVVKKVSFGVFLDVHGVEGLLHQSDISWKKYSPFKDRFKIGDIVAVKIIAMDRDNNRLSLGLKQMAEDPWEWAKRELNQGDIVRGTVTNITDYGAFLELLEGLEGLIHVSELTWSKRVKHPRKYLNIGDEVEAQVLSVDFENRRIALGVKQLSQDPWDRLPEEVHSGDVREGTITSITKFGAFVKVLDEIEGLIHFNDFSWDDRADRKMLKKGDNVSYKVLEVDHKNRRISCGIKQLTESPYEILRKKYKKGDAIDCKVTGITNFGVFVDVGDGFEGLIHISRVPMSEGQKLEELYKVGDPIRAILLNIDPAEKKIALSVKAYEKKQNQDIIDRYIKKDESPSTSSLGEMLKKIDRS